MQRLIILLVAVCISLPALCKAGDGQDMAGCGDAAATAGDDRERGAGQEVGEGGAAGEASTVKSSKSNSSERGTVKGSKSNSSERGTTVKSGKSNSSD